MTWLKQTDRFIIHNHSCHNDIILRTVNEPIKMAFKLKNTQDVYFKLNELNFSKDYVSFFWKYFIENL